MSKAADKKEKNIQASAPSVLSIKNEELMNRYRVSEVERVALEKSNYELIYPPHEKIPSIIVENFPLLGKLTACRFLEWALENPEGVISLPTGKTPEYFIKFTQYFLRTWDKKDTRKTLETFGVKTDRKPDLNGLRFVQIDEFYPIDTKQHNSFFYYVNKYYLKSFGLDTEKSLLINPNKIGIPAGKSLSDIFPDKIVDLSLRFRNPKTLLEKEQQRVIYEVDQFCTEYERRIREMGGIGFFLGGIGPDGHIAFNVRGSDYYSTTRLTEANYETKSAAASDLGGIEVARNKHVITIGLRTLTYNKNGVAIIIAAGEAKAKIVARTIESELSNTYPGTSLTTLPNSRFYLTQGAAKRLKKRAFVDFSKKDKVVDEDIYRIVMDISILNQKKISELTKKDFENTDCSRELLRKTGEDFKTLADKTEKHVIDNLMRGIQPVENKTILHTAPHHDDIILGYLPYFTSIVRYSSTNHYFAYMTSGFNAVTNRYMYGVVEDILYFLQHGQFENLFKEEYFDPNNTKAKRMDTSLYLQGAASHLEEIKREATSRRALRNMIEIYEDDNIINIQQRLVELLNYFKTQYPGKKDITMVQQLKGRMREWESDLKWAYYGFTGETVRHLRLGFYKGDIFTESPTIQRDVSPILSMLHEMKPDIVTVALDPEGSGPDTHYKVMQAIAEALKIYEQETGRSEIKVLGYRNVWYRFHPSEANIYVATSLRHLNDLESAFETCFTTQKSASFPSYEYDGPFSILARKIQVKQFQHIKNFIGEDFFVYNKDHGLRACCGIVYMKEMTLKEFYSRSEELKHLAEEI